MAKSGVFRMVPYERLCHEGHELSQTNGQNINSTAQSLKWTRLCTAHQDKFYETKHRMIKYLDQITKLFIGLPAL